MTDNTVKKKYVELEIYTDSGITYEGRLLGLINDKEYAAVIERSDVRNKLLTVATTPIKSIGQLDDVSGLRIAIALRKRGNTAVINKTLFITEPLDHISTYDVRGEVDFVGSDGSYFIMTEV